MPRTFIALIAAGLLFGAAGCKKCGQTDPQEEESPAMTQNQTPPAPAGVYQFSADSITGEPIDLSTYKGKVLLIVNVASRCGNTPQYTGLQELYETNKDAGLVVLGFPANDFGSQEPGSNEEIQEFCSTTYGVTFPMFAKIHVKGPEIHPLYVWLTDPQIHPDFGGEIGWNFTKFLIGRDGHILARFSPKTQPDDPQLLEALNAALTAE